MTLPPLDPIPRAERLIDLALRTPHLRARASQRFAAIVPAALGDEEMARKPGQLRGSDHGGCVRAVWADVHGKLDIATDFATQLTRFDSGHLFASWMACLLDVGVEETMPGFLVECEADVTYRGVRGHVDVLLSQIVRTGLDDGRDHVVVPRHVYEFKTNYQTQTLKNPADSHRYQVLQAGDYAQGAGAPTFSLVTLAPAVRGTRFAQFDFFTDEWKADVDRDIDRLWPALGDDAPEGDPTESWRCGLCRYSACARNTNPLANALLEVLAS